MDNTTSYIKIASHEAKKGDFNKCVLLYSGGLDTSVMLKWIQDEYGAEVVALTVDLGQMHEDLNAIKEKAVKLGAVKALVYDAKEEFANSLLTKAIKANADYQNGYHLATCLGRVILSEIAVRVAEQEGATVIAHGSTGKGNDQVRFENYVTTLNPNFKTIAPVREWGMGRDEEIDYAHKHGIPISHTKDKPYSYDDNMWGSSAEGGEIEHPSKEIPFQNVLQVCATPEKAPDQAEKVTIRFEKGVPVALNGKTLKLADLIGELNPVGAKHGIGVAIAIEDRLVGLKIRDLYEQPAARILVTAHKKLEQLVSTQRENALKTTVDNEWAFLTYNALWFEPTMNNIHALIDKQNEKVTGEVTVWLYKGNCQVVALNSPYSLFNENLATFFKNDTFNQNASAGFIEIFNLAQKTAYNVKK
ncbi:MAG: argininosuccinate synthase [bacterium]